MDDLKKEAGQEFESSLLVSHEVFMQLFDDLDETLSQHICDDSTGLTAAF